MKRDITADMPVMSRRRFGALAGAAAGSSLLLSSPLRAAAQEVRVARKVGTGVAANPQDAEVFTWAVANSSYFLVYTTAGEVYAHQLENGQVSAPWRLGAIHPLDGRVRRVLGDSSRQCIYVVLVTGEVLSYAVLSHVSPSPKEIGPATRVRVPGPVATNPQDARMLIVGDRLIVVRRDGAAGFHRIESRTQWTAGASVAPDSYRPVASNPQDKWLVPVCYDHLGVVTTGGELFVHRYDFARNAILPPRRANMAQLIATNPQDRFVTSSVDDIYVITNRGDVYGHLVKCGNGP
jgi:hypothetical protein